MNRILSKIYYLLAFSYLLTYISSFLFIENNVLNYITGIWLYLFIFSLIFFFIAFIVILPPKVQNLEPNKALIFLFIYSILSGILFVTFSKIFNTYAIQSTVGFLILVPVFILLGFLSKKTNFNLFHTVSMSILAILILVLNLIFSYFLGSDFNMIDSMILSFFLFYFISINIFHITKSNYDMEYIPNYVLLISINYIYFFLSISRIISIKDILRN